MLPYFKKSESYKQGGDPELRGQDGPLKVEDYRTILPLTHRFVEGAQEAGFPFNPDLNGKQRYGVGELRTIKGRRVVRETGEILPPMYQRVLHHAGMRLYPNGPLPDRWVDGPYSALRSSMEAV